MSDEIPLTREFTVDAGYASRVTLALTRRFFLRRPSSWMLLGFAAIAVFLAVIGDRATWMWFVAAFFVLVTVLLPVLVFFPTRRMYRKLFPAGSILRAGFGDTRFASEAPHFSSTVDYTTYSRAIREGEFVGLRMRATKAWSYFPGSLFTDEDLARFPKG